LKANYKLFIKYIFFLAKPLFLTHTHRDEKSVNTYISANYLYYFSLHVKLSSLFSSSQLVDMFSYETLAEAHFNDKNSQPALPRTGMNTVVYNFHNIFTNKRFYVFACQSSGLTLNKKKIAANSLNSIAELFPNANWLEREVAELHSIFFYFKKDLRNLMLPYGDSSAPMRKSFPSVGTREIFYDVNTDLLIQTPVTLQF